MKRLLLVACILLSGTAHAAVKKPIPLSEMFENRLDQTDELTALKMLPSLHEVRKSWVRSYEGWKDRQAVPETLDTESLDTAPTYSSGTVQDIICSVFGPYCSQALTVVACESGFNTAAVNGQYLGLFQMGESERATYGHGADARTQAEAAFAYFVAAGSDWSPWACKP